MPKRLQWIDYAKGIAILLVVYRHLLIGIDTSGLDVKNSLLLVGEIVFTFRMPLFFILTGIFIRRSLEKRSSKFFIINKVETLLYPYVVWVCIQVTIQILFQDYINVKRTAEDYLYIFTNPRAYDQFWFIYALFNVTIVYLIIYKLFRGNKLAMILLGIIFQVASLFTGNLPVFDDILVFFFFIVLGDIISPYLLDDTSRAKLTSWKVTLILLPPFILLQYCWLEYREYINTLSLSVIAMIGCALMLNISFILAEKNVMKFLSQIGLYSLAIYLMHSLVGAASRVVLVNLLGIRFTELVLVIEIAMACVIPIIFYRLVMNNGLHYFFFPRKLK